MTREHLFWQHYVAQHASHKVLTFNTNAAVVALVCLAVLAFWTTAQVVARCGECEAIPARCRCDGHG